MGILMAGFHKILIANRGEIACRVIRTARDLGYRTVAVYSEADRQALHVRQADEAVLIGPAPVAQSYLVADKILAAAKAVGADAIHPGYGFLSENADFARAVADAGLTFIGPDADAIDLMGSKRRSKLAMLEAGVPCIPGYQDAKQDDETLLAKAGDIGFPLMVKASAGGGGRGLRLVHRQADLADAIRTARSEAENAFGNGELILERAILKPRHIEIQVFADAHGNVVHLGERDCSIQRRHQKVVEEAPSPFVDEALRYAMGEAAVSAARACDYRGAGTVEFLVDGDRKFYFLEMNTRLQVEHPVTELVTGLDLVAWQLLVAAGEPLPLTQQEIVFTGHAVEVRLYAENPREDFLPQTGRIEQWHVPERAGIRVDHGVHAGQVVSPHYDPLLAKVIAFGETRETAVRRLASATEDLVLLGVTNNRQFLANILRHPVFCAGEATTAFIDDHFADDVSLIAEGPGSQTVARAAIILFHRGREKGAEWGSAAPRGSVFRLACDGTTYDVSLTVTGQTYTVSFGGKTHTIELLEDAENGVVTVEGGRRQRRAFAIRGDRLFLDDEGGHFIFRNVTHLAAEAKNGAGSGQVKAPMDGAIVALHVREGDVVERGQTLLVLEAMKMEHPLVAGVAGTVASINAEIGLQVKSKQVLAVIEPAAGEEG